MPRLFTGLEIPDNLSTRLSMMKARISGARWVAKENYHITLRFAGDITDRQADDFVEALDAIEAPKFSLTLDGLGSFGSRKPRSIWARVAENDPLRQLQAAHERAARIAGIPPESRNFIPHVTLAWLKGVSTETVASFIQDHGAPITETFEVTRFVLYSSRPSRGGGPYIVEEAFSLL